MLMMVMLMVSTTTLLRVVLMVLDDDDVAVAVVVAHRRYPCRPRRCRRRRRRRRCRHVLVAVTVATTKPEGFFPLAKWLHHRVLPPGALARHCKTRADVQKAPRELSALQRQRREPSGVFRVHSPDRAPEAAPEAATSELYRWRHSHDQDTLHVLHVRKVKTPSSSQMHGQGVQLTPITECELQAVSNHSQSQQGHVCREGLWAQLFHHVQRAPESATLCPLAHAAGS